MSNAMMVDEWWREREIDKENQNQVYYIKDTTQILYP